MWAVWITFTVVVCIDSCLRLYLRFRGSNPNKVALPTCVVVHAVAIALAIAITVLTPDSQVLAAHDEFPVIFRMDSFLLFYQHLERVSCNWIVKCLPTLF
jgi:hypothetical protein